MRCQRIGKHQADFMKPIEGMELLILHHCPTILVREMGHLKQVIHYWRNSNIESFFVVVLEERHTLSNSSEYRTEEEKESQTH